MKANWFERRHHRCWNCKTLVLFGFLCVDCVRAMLLAAAGTFGATFIHWMWK